MSEIIQSAVNISEGRNRETIDAIVDTVCSLKGVVVADWSADFDHNRMVVSLLGNRSGIHRAIMAIARSSVARIDLRSHRGAHPRIGAVDVIPLTPIRAATMDVCRELAIEIGESLANELGLPVYFYGYSAQPGRRSALPDIRRGGFEALAVGELAGDRKPDMGPKCAHPTAGAVVVGARDPLVAYNVNLREEDLAAAMSIARNVRKDRNTDARLDGVRALGLHLPSRNRTQISMNLTSPLLTPLPTVFDYVLQEAERYKAKVIESEVVGLIPRSSLHGEQPARIQCRDFRETQLIETWLAGLND